MVPPMTKRPRLERPARVLVGKVFADLHHEHVLSDPLGAVVWGQLRASSTTLTFDFDDGRPSIELRRGQVNEGGCLRRTNSKSKNDKHLLRVPLLGGRASYIFSLASAEAQVRMRATCGLTPFTSLPCLPRLLSHFYSSPVYTP
jgi:hypothetical protein